MSQLLGRIIALVTPWRFEPGSAGDIDATIALRVRVRARVAEVAIAISGGTCTARAEPAVDAAATATIALADLIRLVLGDVGWPQLLSQRRFEFSGDPFLAMRLPALFRLPVAGRTRASSAAGPGSSAVAPRPEPAPERSSQ